MKRSTLPHLLAKAMDADVQQIGSITYSAECQTPEHARTLARDMRERGIFVHTHPWVHTLIYFSDVSVPAQDSTGN